MIRKRNALFPMSVLTSGILLAILFGEFAYLSLNFDARLLAMKYPDSWFRILGSAGDGLRVVLVAFAVFVALSHRRILEFAKQVGTHRLRIGWLCIHLACFGLLALATDRLFSLDAAQSSLTEWSIGWIFAVAMVAQSWLLCFAPFRIWLEFLKTEVWRLVAAGFCGLAACLVGYGSQKLWVTLHAGTFQLSKTILEQLITGVICDPPTRLLGTNNFSVTISAPCSGFEGIGLVLVFTSFYLTAFRKEFRFPNALLLIPLGVSIVWLFNSLRIVTLILIGDKFSPELAIGGFHSQAGWISFLTVAIGILYAAHHLRFFSNKRHDQVQSPQQSTQATKSRSELFLIPLMALLASTILTSAFYASGVDLLYPIRVLVTAVAICFVWRKLSLPTFRIAPATVVIGLLVFVVWIALVPTSEMDDILLSPEYLSTPILVTWILIRTFGAVVTVPIAEELAFRGYLLARLSKSKVSATGNLQAGWVPIILSSLLFGLLHSAMIAGTLAGIAYGFVRCRSKSVLQPVVCHAITNLALSIYVISSGHWSLW